MHFACTPTAVASKKPTGTTAVPAKYTYKYDTASLFVHASHDGTFTTGNKHHRWQETGDSTFS